MTVHLASAAEEDQENPNMACHPSLIPLRGDRSSVTLDEGFDCEFVERPPSVFIVECPICMLVLREPHQATCCGKSYCRRCIEKHKDSEDFCPTCRQQLFGLFHNLGLEQSLYDFEVYCSQKSKGCEWRGELRELEKHLNSEPAADKSLEGCPFTVIKCPLSHTGCEVKLPRKDMKDHMNNDWLSHLLKQTALEQKVALRVEKEKKEVKEELLSLNTRLISVSEELQKLQGEKQYLEQCVTELEEEVKELKAVQNVLSYTGQPIGQVEFTMTNFEQRKKEDSVSLPLFYTHPHGYKMCSFVHPNGLASGKGTHLGMTMHLLRGEFDDHLKWPFRGKVFFLLLDQEGKDHIGSVIPFDDNTPDEGTKRPVTVEMNRKGPGSCEIIALALLRPKYLKNDCIKFAITKIELTR